MPIPGFAASVCRSILQHAVSVAAGRVWEGATAKDYGAAGVKPPRFLGV
jgi:hypothetical protein